MASRATALIVLAAGKGTRMVSDRPKVLHEVGGLPLLAHTLRSGAVLAPQVTVVVSGHGAEAVEAAARRAAPAAHTVRQETQLGTGHAVAQGRAALEGFDGDALVLYGDTPFIRAATLDAMQAARDTADIVVLGFEPTDPARYGRLIVEDGTLTRIVEFKDATAAERAVTLCNSGVVLADAQALMRLVDRIGNDNAGGEYYLTDIVGLAVADGLTCQAVTCDAAETAGVNTRADLAAAEATFQARRRAEIMEAGVTLTAPDTVHLSVDTVIGYDSVVGPHVVFGPGVRVDPGVRIHAFSHLEGARVAQGAVIGPYARLRPGADIGPESHVGNFVEIKNARLGQGAKANHLTYVGDATVGARANLGAGTVTCNYDGVSKHHTAIGADAFIGSSTMLVAPVSVGAGAMTASGSVITTDVPDDALAVGRARQDTKPGFAKRLRDRLRAAKAASTTSEKAE